MWSREARAAADERDADRRLDRPATPSTSSVPQRCGACGHWGIAGRWVCACCGLPWAPVENRGMAVGR